MALRKLIDDINANIVALRVLNIDVDACDVFVNSIVMSKLDHNTRKEFENTLTADVPKRADLILFLEKKCTTLESMSQDQKPKTFTPPLNAFPKKFSAPFKTTHVTAAKFSCHYCKQNHNIVKCEEFLVMSVSERRRQVEKRGLCLKRLRTNHVTKDCKVTSACRVCNEKDHHTLLHQDRVVTSENSEPQPSTSQFSTNHHCFQTREPSVILSTAVVFIQDEVGNNQKCRCLLDMGSQLNLISKSICERLKLKTFNSLTFAV